MNFPKYDHYKFKTKLNEKLCQKLHTLYQELLTFDVFTK